jgi:hypothetical protein
MAYLRRGLVTNRGAIPSIHTKQANANNYGDSDVVEMEHEQQPVLVLRKVKRVIKMGHGNEHHVVELECGHTALSRGTFQTTCKKCAAKEAA